MIKPFQVGAGLAVDMTQIVLLIIFLMLLNSATNTIPLSTAIPNKAIKPTPALILKGIPLRAKNKIPPIVDSGIAV